MEIILSEYLNNNDMLCEYIPIAGANIGISESYNNKLENPTYIRELVYINKQYEYENQLVLELKSVIKINSNRLCISINSYEIIQVDKLNNRWRYYIDNKMYDSYHYNPTNISNVNEFKRLYIENGKYIEKNGIDCYDNICIDPEYAHIDTPIWFSP